MLLVGALGMPVAVADERGLVRVAHLSPDSPAVDVALTPVAASGEATLTDPGPDVDSGLGYGAVGSYHDVAPGSYAVSLRAAGAPRSTPPVLSVRVDVPAGGARTVTVSGRFADLALHVLTDDLGPPGGGAARVRVLAAAAGAGPLDVTLGAEVLATDLPFATAGRYAVLPAGQVSVRVDDGTGAPAHLPLDLDAGSVTTLLALDGPDGGLELRAVLDAAGPAVVPTGGVEAGSGPPATLPALVLVGSAATALARLPGRRLALVLAAASAAVALPAAPPPVVPPAPAAAVALAAQDPPVAAMPVRLRVPTAGVDTTLPALALDGGVLAPPADPATAGWYAAGPAPGEPGPAVIAGHVDWAGRPAVFARLATLAVGDEVLVERGDGTTARFAVTRVDRYSKSAFPTADVYGPTPDAQLRLITCGGDFDRAAGSYEDNVVVSAEQIPPR